MSTRSLAALAVTTATVAVAASPAQAGPALETLRQRDSGSTVTVSLGQRIHVKLAECRTCGYRWRVATAPDPQVLERGRRSYRSTCKAPCVGGSGTATFRYSAVDTGTTSLRLRYFGPGATKPDKTFRVTIRVVAGQGV